MFEVSPDNPLRSNLKAMLQAAYRAEELVKNILTYSRQQESKQIPVSPTFVIKETLQLLRASLPASIEIRQKFDDVDGAIIADPIQIHQALMNLVVNASHAMQRNAGVLGIRLTRIDLDSADDKLVSNLAAGSYFCIEVSDTGPGMTPEVMDRIFDPYFSTKKKTGGMGLGLSVAQGIVKSYGGAITVESRLESGSTFRIFLPRVLKAPAAPNEKLSETVPKGVGCVLFVDDESAIVEYGKQALEQLGYDVLATNHVVEALEDFSARPNRFDIVVTDYTMPDMNGLEFAEKLISIRPDLPVILCSGYNEMLTGEIAEKSGISEVIQKPYSVHKLANTVHRLSGIVNKGK